MVDLPSATLPSARPAASPHDAWLNQSPEGLAVFPLPHLASISVTGADARSFLHGQFTNDLMNLPAGEAQLSAWCSAQGRVIANFLLYARPLSEGAEEIRLLFHESLRATVPQRLGRYVLRAKVEFADMPQSFFHLGISGAKAGATRLAECLAATELPRIPDAPLAVTHDGDVSLLRLPDEDRLILSVPAARLDAIQRTLEQSLSAATPELWQWLDVQYGLPWVSSATSEAFVPQMMNLEQLGYVSFKKGCYPGQEVVARTHYLGQVKRRLYRVESDEVLCAGNEWPNNGASIGKILQAAPAPDRSGYAALAVLSCAEANAMAPCVTALHPNV